MDEPASNAAPQAHGAIACCGLTRVAATLATVALVVALTGCQGTPPILGGANTAVTGGAGGATAQGANDRLERCSEPLGTLAVVEDQTAPWYGRLSSEYKLGSTVPVLRTMIQQSNCFVVVERGRAFAGMERERQLRDSGEMRQGSQFDRGQVAAADYTMSPTITFSEKNTGGARGFGAGALPGVIGFLSGGVKFNEANTNLLMIDNRSGVQLAAASGSSRNVDFNVFGFSWFGALGGGGAYTNTPEGKLIVAAFVDAYNGLVQATRNYKAQEVRGGLGTGGQLGVQGGARPPAEPRK